MPLNLTRKGLSTLSSITELDDERVEILWIVKEMNEEPGGVAGLNKVVKETGRGREAIRDVRDLIDTGHLRVFDY